MRHVLLSAGLFLATALLPAVETAAAAMAFPQGPAPYCGVYRCGAANPKGGEPGNAAFAAWLNRPAVWAIDYTPGDTWDDIRGQNWQLSRWGSWKKAVAGRRLILAVQPFPGPKDLSGAKTGPGAGQRVSLAQGAHGDYNAHFKALAENLVRSGLGDAVIRWGWEFNGNWFAWRGAANPAAFAEFWRQVVKTMRAVPGTQGMQFCWNPSIGRGEYPCEQSWPGDEWVDIVGPDHYDRSWARYPYPANATAAQIEAIRHLVWDKEMLNSDHGFLWWRTFAATHKKPLCVPEWGVDDLANGHGGLDNVYFIEQMRAWLYDPTHPYYFECYFDVEADRYHQLSPGIDGSHKTRFPKASVRYRELWTLKANKAPVVSLTSPATGATVTAPATVTMTAKASDADGRVAKVEFYRGSVKIGEDATAPYACVWTQASAGSHTLTARAIDNAGAVTVSAATTLIVNAPPTVSLTSPRGGARSLRNQPLTITAQAADGDDSVTAVDFIVDGTVIHRESWAPFTWEWATPTVGSHVIQARAFDQRGGVTTSSAVTMTVVADFSARVNFQPASSMAVDGWLVDDGSIHADHGGLDYGWNIDVSATMRDRNHARAADQRHDTLVHLQKPETPEAVWEMAVPDGAYQVTVLAGDPLFLNSDYRIAVEGVLAVSGVPDADHAWMEGVVQVVVSDGRLTVGSAPGADNNKLCSIAISAVASLPALALAIPAIHPAHLD